MPDHGGRLSSPIRRNYTLKLERTSADTFRWLAYTQLGFKKPMQYLELLKQAREMETTFYKNIRLENKRHWKKFLDEI